ncbi:MAG: DUF58 domain-containing protein [Candidatus Heimdallarchaeota archaeon]
MFTPKIRWTLASFFGILLLGIGFRNWLILLALIPISILIISYFIIQPPEELDIEVIREIDQTRYQEGEHIQITLKIKNHGKKTIEMMEVHDILPLQVSLKKGSNHIITTLDSGEETVVRYEIRCDYRGRWNLGPTHIRARNFTNSVYTVATYEETISDLVVIPNFELIKDMPFRTKYPKISDGPFHSKLKGEGLDFSGVREFTSSDSIGRINWPATAKYNKLFANEYELFRSADLLLVLDATEKTGSVLDEEIKAVLSLTEHFLKYKCRVGLVIIRDIVDRFDLSSSRQQLMKFTEKLIDIQATKMGKASILKDRLDNNLDKHFPKNCLTIFITPLIDQKINNILVQTARRRRNSFFLVPSIIDSEWRFIKDKENAANVLVHQDLKIRRKTEIIKVYQKGVIVIEWDISIPFSVFMNKLKQISVKRGGSR